MTTIRTLLILALLGLAGITAAQQEEDDAGAQPDEAEEADADAGERPTTVIDELSQAEIDAELARAEEILDDPGDVEEFTDTKPLPADLPLALPSDF